MTSLRTDLAGGFNSLLIFALFNFSTCARYGEEEGGNALVEALAGSAKTSTIRAAIRMIPRRNTARVVVITFNKENSNDLHAKGVFQAKTCHSLGFAILRDIPRTARAAANIKNKKTDFILDAICTLRSRRT